MINRTHSSSPLWLLCHEPKRPLSFELSSQNMWNEAPTTDSAWTTESVVILRLLLLDLCQEKACPHRKTKWDILQVGPLCVLQPRPLGMLQSLPLALLGRCSGCLCRILRIWSPRTPAESRGMHIWHNTSLMNRHFGGSIEQIALSYFYIWLRFALKIMRFRH